MTRPSLTFNLPADFYHRYWQREPLVIRAAIPAYTLPLSPDELAGLACMPEVESRIVLERGGRTPWEVRHGPFEEAAFATLPDSHWTLLVQAVDHWEPEIAALKHLFPRIPDWRFDDVMLSYAADGGSVGPHVDRYDVFLLQGLGRRCWRLGGRPGEDAVERDDTEWRLLAEFDTQVEYILEPGDALYLPPGVAHWGIADGECVTVSIGFRAPAIGEVIDGYAAHRAARLPDARRYRDPEPVPDQPGHPGEISAATLQRLLEQVRAELVPATFADWFGEFVTQPRYPAEVGESDADASPHALAAGATVNPRRDARFAFFDTGEELLLFANGARFPCPRSARSFVEGLCEGRAVAAADIDAQTALIIELLRLGCVDVDPVA
jgi:50S ribosomal protein L16 3-hydroxylase